MGIPCDVESRATLALIATQAEHAARLAAPEERVLVLALAKRHGFTHLAVELSPGATGAGAPVLRD
jgi:hypothetical protein